MAIDNTAYAALDADSPLVPYKYTLREPEADEVIVKVMYCGICHSDVMAAKNKWKSTNYPIVVGHEIAGLVDRMGKEVSEFKVGDRVGVGCFVDSCQSQKCAGCKSGEEQFCPKLVQTYLGFNRGERTYGGYGKYVIVNKRFLLRIPDSIPLDKAAPLLCAGITTYNPIFSNRMDRGNLTIAVVGLGGLGHMALQIAKNCGPNNDVYVISRSDKKADLAKELGATKLIKVDELDQYKRFFDYVISTIPAGVDSLDLSVLKPRGSYIILSAPPAGEELRLNPFPLLLGSHSIQGSLVGGVRQTQEMLQFCAAKNVLPRVEEITEDRINEAYERMERSDVLFRFVINVEQSTF